jgi:hypothetical protein
MTGARLPLVVTTAVRDRAADPESEAGQHPVIVLTYQHAGGARLRSLLARHSELACTSGTGILPLCELTAAAWRAVDGRPAGPPSRLAETSTRVLATSMITALLARQGKRRWCEFATAAPDAAVMFVRLFPSTRIVCLHRACPDFVYAAVRASPWGLAGPDFAPFISAHPASTTAALTSYWVARTAALLAFEQEHPGICHRVRYEELGGDSPSGLPDFLGLAEPGSRPAAWRYDETADFASGSAGPATDFPAGQIPSPLLERASDLMGELGYPPVGGR